MKEHGYQKQINASDASSIGTAKNGSFTYVWQGMRYTTYWIADENGYRANVYDPIAVSDETYASDELLGYNGDLPNAIPVHQPVL